MLVEPARQWLGETGSLPAHFTIDDCRAVIFFIARGERFVDGYLEAPGNLHLYFACLDSIRRKLIRAGR